MHKKVLLLLLMIFLPAVFLWGCGKKMPDGKETLGSQVELDEGKIDFDDLARGEVEIEVQDLADYASGKALLNEQVPEQMEYFLEMPQIPESDDTYLYLFAVECYEDRETLSGKPIAAWIKKRVSEVTFSYKEGYLFKQFIPALLIDEKYVPIGKGIYLANPEVLAENQEPYPETGSKKGILLDPTMLGTEKLTDLEVKHSIYNIPLSIIMGETTDQAYPTIIYTYQGKDYKFNGKVVSDYDGLFSYLTSIGMCSTAVVLNDWNDNYLEMIHPKAREQKKGVYYYMFNTEEEEGGKRA